MEGIALDCLLAKKLRMPARIVILCRGSVLRPYGPEGVWKTPTGFLPKLGVPPSFRLADQMVLRFTPYGRSP